MTLVEAIFDVASLCLGSFLDSELLAGIDPRRSGAGADAHETRAADEMQQWSAGLP
jgi:hypothetical protein